MQQSDFVHFLSVTNGYDRYTQNLTLKQSQFQIHQCILTRWANCTGQY